MTMPPETPSECAFVDRELDCQLGTFAAHASERLSRHLAVCPRCGTLYSWMLAPPADLDASPDLYREIHRSLQSSVRPVRPLRATGVLVLQFAAVLFLLTVVAVSMAGTEGLRRMTLTQISGIGAVLLSGVVLVSFSLVWQMIPGSLQRYAATAILPALAAAFLLGIALLFPWRAPEAFLAFGTHCLGLGLLMSAMVAIPCAFFARRGAVQSIAALGATLGAAAGLVSVAVLQLSCTHQDLGHLFVWHGSVLAGSILLGAGIAALAR